MRLFAMFFVPVLVLAGIEVGLRLGGYGYDTGFFRRILIDGRGYYVPNDRFSDRFFPSAIARKVSPTRFAVEKATNCFRIFLFGESAANGDPDQSYGMGRYLQVLLRERYPGVDFEVVCVAITAVDSHVILPIARDCAQHEGDLWVIYMGNNEMVGPFGAETAFGMQAPPLGIVRTVLAIKATRTGQLLDNVIQRLSGMFSKPKAWGGMQMFVNNRIGYDDPARLRAYANFKGNLEDILRIAHQKGVPVILSTVAVNLEDCAPFASIHARNLSTNQLSEWNELFDEAVTNETARSFAAALASYRRAAEIDPKFAELQFRMGNCDLEQTNWIQAYTDFSLARDYDALDFRADTRINSTIQDAAARHAKAGVHLVDAAQIVAQNSPDGIPGLNFFYEHVHLNFAGNYLVALALAEKVKASLPGRITTRDQGDWASEELCERRLAVTGWDRQRVWQPIFERITAPPFTGQYCHAALIEQCEVKRNQAILQMNRQSPEQARRVYEQALALAPGDYFLHGNYEQFLEARGDLEPAVAEAKRCSQIFPELPGSYYYVGTLLVREGKVDEATNYFLRALAIRPHYAEAETAMGEILANQQRTAQAVRWLNRAIRSDPEYVESYLALGFLDQEQGRAAAAMANYQKAASLEPEGPADYFHRANLAANRYLWEEAIADLQGVVQAKPEFWQAHYLLGIQLAAMGRKEEAQKEFSVAIHYRPDYAPAHLYLGIIMLAQKEPAQALAEFQKTLQLDPANNSARQEIAIIQSPANPGGNSDRIASPPRHSDE